MDNLVSLSTEGPFSAWFSEYRPHNPVPPIDGIKTVDAVSYRLYCHATRHAKRMYKHIRDYHSDKTGEMLRDKIVPILT